jgi:hypothetical protein
VAMRGLRAWYGLVLLLLTSLASLATFSAARKSGKSPFVYTDPELSDAGAAFSNRNIYTSENDSDNNVDDDGDAANNNNGGRRSGGRGGSISNGGLQIMITRSMRRTLQEELRYLSSEVDAMDPQVGGGG